MGCFCLAAPSRARGGSACSHGRGGATINLIDYDIEISGDITTGEQMLQVNNTGTELHKLVVFKLKEGFSFEEFQALLESEDEPQEEPPFEDVGVTLLSPGVSNYVTMDFAEPGQYVLICFLSSEKNGGASHFSLGMVQELTVP